MFVLLSVADRAPRFSVYHLSCQCGNQIQPANCPEPEYKKNSFTRDTSLAGIMETSTRKEHLYHMLLYHTID